MATDQSEGRRKLLFQLFLRTGRVESEQVIHLGQLPWSCLVLPTISLRQGQRRFNLQCWSTLMCCKGPRSGGEPLSVAKALWKYLFRFSALSLASRRM